MLRLTCWRVFPRTANATFFGDGVVVDYGKVDGRRVGTFSQDFTVRGGTIGPIHRGKMTTIIDKAVKMDIPIIGLWDSTGGRLEQSNAPHSCARSSFFRRFTEASGVTPQISAILGLAAGNAGYGATLTDFVFMVEENPQLISQLVLSNMARLLILELSSTILDWQRLGIDQFIGYVCSTAV